MSIRRIGPNPFVNTASLIQSQRRIERVEKHIGAEDAELKTEEEALDALNNLHHAEMEALQAEREQKAKQTESLRAQLVLRDGYEARSEELVDLTGGAREAYERDLLELQAREKANKPGVSLAHLARANVYERVSREERAAAQRAELERAEAERIAAELAAAEEAEAAARESVPMLDEEALPEESEEEGEVDWMAEELAMLQDEDGESDASDEEDEEEEYVDPEADSFLASLEDVENLEQAPAEDPHAGGFLASLDDIAQLAPGSDAEVDVEVAEEQSEEWAPEEGAREAAADEEGASEVSAEAGEDFVAEVEEGPAAHEDAPEADAAREPDFPAAMLPFDDESAEATASPESRPEAEAVEVLPFDDEDASR
ncbi:putative exosome complex exonuclease 1 [Cystobacter fuscus DSM 2262]|uniref:Exosome complex exonuclease 1 n=1 Tax=Cystobacter fuscus (strain ATCC 25194 / DSM 2262 / NBRC 100088 / M29) TaxID=1242864 RepID=S9PN42_CYSF2|nr:hypothetical protein [Cystobacter fuscus]EPX64441.1 putative exosome complex exonuclease 1 [Cystobacter fuscus DSM 2262]